MGDMLYLIHVHLAPHPAGIPLPLHAAPVIAGAVPPDAGVLHVAVHPSGGPGPVVGVYLECAALDLAEAAARRAWHGVVRALPWFGGWAFLQAEAPLIPDIEGWPRTGG
ncbi:hypothetical protein ACFWBF_18310 [Streptomyces sp. NPDC060028]|uniref:hypothetical protein n=1 Tax=Streptomyces sp. NPDC060028 TaxID=3347041 RepID=UPI003697642D